MRFLLSVIAVCLLMITAKLYIPSVQAHELSKLDYRALARDRDFQKAVTKIVEDKCELNYYDSVYFYDYEYVTISISEDIDC